MPAAKKLHESSQNDSTAESTLGRFLHARGALAHRPVSRICCVPLSSRVHQRLVFSNRHQRTPFGMFTRWLVVLAPAAGTHADDHLAISSARATMRGPLIAVFLASSREIPAS